MELGWIVQDLIDRAWRALGSFRAREWRQFVDQVGLRVVLSLDLPATVPALLFRRTIIVRAGLDDWTTAWLVWHEAGHFLLHCGNQFEWRELVCGDLILAKQERQAEEFATSFPDWSDDGEWVD